MVSVQYGLWCVGTGWHKTFVIWHVIVWRRYGVARYGIGAVRFRYGVSTISVRYHTVSVWYGMVWYATVRRRTISSAVAFMVFEHLTLDKQRGKVQTLVLFRSAVK